MSVPTTNVQFGSDSLYYVFRDTNNEMVIRDNDIDILRMSDIDVKINGEGGLIISDTASLVPKAHLHIKREDPVFLIQDLETNTNNATSIIRFADSDENSGILDINNLFQFTSVFGNFPCDNFLLI